MMRSDILLARGSLNQITGEEKTILILKLMYKIEAAYKIVFALENNTNLKPIAEVLRQALESE